MSKLAEKQCVPCRGGVPPLEGEGPHRAPPAARRRLGAHDEHHLERLFTFPDFQQASTSSTGSGRWPRSRTTTRRSGSPGAKVRLTIWTHKIDGLTRAISSWAAKAEALVGSS